MTRGLPPASSISPNAQFAGLTNLPPAPGILMEIWDVVGSENGSARKLAEILERDPALTAKLLRLANSAYFAVPRPISDVRSACVILGFELVRNIAISVASFDALTRRVGRILDLQAFWCHSVAVGVCAKGLSSVAGLTPGSCAFCAGILHDIGKLVLATHSLEAYARVVERVEHSAGTITDVRLIEREELGLDHEQAGLEIARLWRFPAEILSAVGHHHEPWTEPGDSRWSALLGAANWMARRLGFESVPTLRSEVASLLDARTLERLLLSAAALEETLAQLTPEVPQKVVRFCDSVRV
ncbi:MAG TPA: HDOD domain-containing protein [bacterium]|nr:HDOD domain-containing protein [bacterium]